MYAVLFMLNLNEIFSHMFYFSVVVCLCVLLGFYGRFVFLGGLFFVFCLFVILYTSSECILVIRHMQ